MSTLLMPVLRGTLPGYPPAPMPDVLQILMLILIIPAVMAAFIAIVTMGPEWLRRSAAPTRALPADAKAESLPSPAELEAKRELVHQAAVQHEARVDRPHHGGKTDPESYHP